MERRGRNHGTQNNGRRAVPQFGAWDQNGGASPNYSVVFNQARAQRKQAKTEVKPLSLGNETDLLNHQNPQVIYRHHGPHHDHRQEDSAMRRNRFLTYCCVTPY